MAQQLPLLDRSTAPVRPARPTRPVRSAARGATPRPARALAVVADRPDELIEVDGVDWRLDEHTKEVGLAGVAAARRALAEAVSRSAA